MFRVGVRSGVEKANYCVAKREWLNQIIIDFSAGCPACPPASTCWRGAACSTKTCPPFYTSSSPSELFYPSICPHKCYQNLYKFVPVWFNKTKCLVVTLFFTLVWSSVAFPVNYSVLLFCCRSFTARSWKPSAEPLGLTAGSFLTRRSPFLWSCSRPR